MAQDKSLENDLADIRRAAFDLRQSDPNDAVRVLRRLIKKGSEVSALAHGALGEILLDEFDDVDGALHHYERLLVLAPGLPAAELGLARAVARQGAGDRAVPAYRRAIESLIASIEKARTEKSEEEPAGLEEALLTLLDAAIEERETIEEFAAGQTATPLPAELFTWAESDRLFDLDDEAGDDEAVDEDRPADTDDWARYATLRGVIEALDGRVETGLEIVERVAVLAPLSIPQLLRARSLTCEAGGHFEAAALEARKLLEPVSAASESLDVLRTVDLFIAAERLDEARNLLDQYRAALRERLENKSISTEERELVNGVLKELEARASATPARALVSLGLGRRLS